MAPCAANDPGLRRPRCLPFLHTAVFTDGPQRVLDVAHPHVVVDSMGVAAPRKLGLLAGVFVATSVAQASRTKGVVVAAHQRLAAGELGLDGAESR